MIGQLHCAGSRCRVDLRIDPAPRCPKSVSIKARISYVITPGSLLELAPSSPRLGTDSPYIQWERIRNIPPDVLRLVGRPLQCVPPDPDWLCTTARMPRGLRRPLGPGVLHAPRRYPR